MRALTPRMGRLSDRMRVATDAARDLPAPDLSSLRAEIRSLRALLVGTGGGAGAGSDRVRAAIAEYRETGRLADARSARFACWGTRIAEADQPALIEDGDLFAPFLDEVDGYRAMPRPYRRCWRGLLDGYIRYDPDDAPEVGRQNWTLLRTYLNDNLPALERSGLVPDWLRTIDENSNLLTANPCGRYGARLLEDGAEVLDPLRRELSAGDSSWIVRRIFDAQIDAAVAFEDKRFRRALSPVLDLIEDHEFLADKALARILDRYADCASTEVEPGLRDASVGRWGNPWLDRNDKRWGEVAHGTRQMVSSWLKLRFMEDFFRLLSEDGVNDLRRLNFWKRYVDEIDDMHFALGEAAYDDPRPDFQKLKKSMDGRLLRLESGGTPRNNAFIMKIGGHVFVEFGEKGNAMYAFDGEALPFDLRKFYISGNRAALKHPDHVARIVHIDSAGRSWEAKIERRMMELGTGRPGSSKGLGDRAESAVRNPPQSQWKPAEMRSPYADPNADHVAFLSAYGIKSVDSRDKGGSLWAYAPVVGPASGELRKRGFAWSERRGAWYTKA